MGSVYSEARNEIPLMTFTFLLPFAWGMSFFGFVGAGRTQIAVVALVVAALGTLASILHLAKPLRAPLSISHFKTSWLSREILAASAFDLAVACWAILRFVSAPDGWCLLAEGIAVALGALLVYTMSAAYRVHSRPTWNGRESLFELIGCAAGTGSTAVGAIIAASGSPVPILLALGPLADMLLCWYASKKRSRRIDREQYASALSQAARLRLSSISGAVRTSIALKAVACLLLLIGGLSWQPASSVAVIGALAAAAIGALLTRIAFYSMAVSIPHAVGLRKIK